MFFYPVTRNQAGMVAGATRHDMHVFDLRQQLCSGRTKSRLKHPAIGNALFQRFGNRVCLLVNFFLHVVTETSALYSISSKFTFVDVALDRIAIDIRYFNFLASDNCDVAFFQKLEDIAHLDVVIMGIRVGAELDFLDLDRLLLFPRLGFPLLHLVFVFAKIHDFGDRRVGVRRNFHQIEPDFLGKLAAALGRDNAQIFAFGANQAKLIRGDALIRAGSGVALRWRVMWSACYLT